MTVRAALVTSLAVIALDRVTKAMVMRFLELGQVIVVFPGWFSLTHVLNQGAAFGILGAGGSLRRVVLIVAAVGAVAALGWLLLKMEPTRRWERMAAAAVIGGALGNLIDRLAYGAVVDFLDVHAGPYHWPAFNVADSAITVGVSILVLASFAESRVTPKGPVAGSERIDR